MAKNKQAYGDPPGGVEVLNGLIDSSVIGWCIRFRSRSRYRALVRFCPLFRTHLVWDFAWDNDRGFKWEWSAHLLFWDQV